MSILILTTEPLVPGALAYAQSARSKHLSAVQLEWNLQVETKYEGNQFFKAACCYVSQPNWWWLPVETQILVAWIMFTHNLCNLLKGGLKPEPWLQKRSRYHDHVGANVLYLCREDSVRLDAFIDMEQSVQVPKKVLDRCRRLLSWPWKDWFRPVAA